MNKLYTTLLSATVLTLFAAAAFASSTNVDETNMQHYVFTYHINKTVDPISHQYNETRQDINYVLVLDIQRQVNSNLDNMASIDNFYLDGLTAKVGQSVSSHLLNKQLLAL
jgi:hypothetical protein